MTMSASFASEFLAGFECSTHRRWDGKRLDMLAATQHDRLAEKDYQLARDAGMSGARDGLRWHLIEPAPGQYDWSSFLPMLQAADRAGTQVVWDLCHYGVPDHLDIWTPRFIESFARFAAAAAEVVRDHSGMAPLYCPVNEISYWAWAGGDVGRFDPSERGRGAELKRQLVRAYLAAVRAIREVDPRARFFTAEPIINVVAGLVDEAGQEAASIYHHAQYEALDMLVGTMEPELGGFSAAVDMVGVNFYPDNQWFHGGSTVPLGHHAYRPLRAMLAEVHARYGRPLLLSETGSEGTARPTWIHYVASEVRAARAAGVRVEGICLYPVLDYPGWENDRNCEVGLFCGGPQRQCYEPLAEQLREEQDRFARQRSTAAIEIFAPQRRTG